MYEHLKVEARGDVAVVRIDRAPANAMSPELAEEGAGVLEQLRAEEPGAVVLTGTGSVFSAGADLKLVPTLDAEGQKAMVMIKGQLRGELSAWARELIAAEDEPLLVSGWTSDETAGAAARTLRGN